MESASNITDEMTHETLLRVIKKVHLLTGITVSEQKKSMMQSRLRKRMRELSIATYDDYMDYLDKTANETQNFVNVVTTNETVFFRTPRIWTYFQQEFLPAWFRKNPTGVLKVWSAASSSGEEAYSIAISCLEFKSRNPSFEFKIMGSDISTFVLAEAEKGQYFERSLEFFRKSSPEIFQRYFTPVGPGGFEVVSELKRRVQFSTHNLFTVKKEEFDIVFLRNVLIYFSSVDQEKVLNNISKSVKKEGVLVIGESESLNRLNTPFEFKSACIYGSKT